MDVLALFAFVMAFYFFGLWGGIAFLLVSIYLSLNAS